jgi:exosortase H (IPTLxxWG-CTERM-specific)
MLTADSAAPSSPSAREARVDPSSARRNQLAFVIRFVVIAGALSALYQFPYQERSGVQHWLDAYLAAYARVAGLAIRLFDSNARVDGAGVLGSFSIRIVKDCDAMDVNILFAAGVLAFPSSWRRRLVGLASGLAAIFAANIARICGLYFIGSRAPSAFELAHREVFPLLLAALAAGVFLLWAHRDDKDGKLFAVHLGT